MNMIYFPPWPTDNTRQTAMSAVTAFISGPIDTGPHEIYFHTHYVPLINQAIRLGHHFIIGPLPHGVDADALTYLVAYPVSPSRITIFVTRSEDEAWGADFRALGVHVHVAQSPVSRGRDAAMTAASTYDILRLRSHEEARGLYGRIWRPGHVTNTERNWKRRRGIAEDVVVDVEEINRSVGTVLSDMSSLAAGLTGAVEK
jgi:hypothetical protein